MTSVKNGAFVSSYRYFALSQLTTNQVDIGGALPGDKLGVPTARAPRPQKPDFLVGGLTTTITPTLTNNFIAAIPGSGGNGRRRPHRRNCPGWVERLKSAARPPAR